MSAPTLVRLSAGPCVECGWSEGTVMVQTMAGPVAACESDCAGTVSARDGARLAAWRAGNPRPGRGKGRRRRAL